MATDAPLVDLLRTLNDSLVTGSSCWPRVADLTPLSHEQRELSKSVCRS
jgi:hypothetical protein